MGKGSQGERITGGMASSAFRAVVQLVRLLAFYGEEGSLIRVLESVTITKRGADIECERK